MVDFFRVLGLTAGLAGLGLGLFIVVAKSVIKAMPQTGSPGSEEGTLIVNRWNLNLLGRIMRYAFVIALVSIVVYALLQLFAVR